MSLYKEIEKLKYDKRLIDWHLSRGKLSQEEHEKYLASLPDSATNVENFSIAEEGGVGEEAVAEVASEAVLAADFGTESAE